MDGGLRCWVVAGVLGVVGVARVSLGDSLWISSGGPGTGTIEYKGVKVLNIEGGKLYFRTAAGNGDSSRDLEQIRRMTIDDEASLSAGEMAFAGGQFDAAVDEYLRAQRGTSKGWLKPWIALRLMSAAAKAQRFDAAAAAYVELVLVDAKLAQANRPRLEGVVVPKAGVLDAAAAEVDKGLSGARGAGLLVPQRLALLQFQLEIQRARGDKARVAKVLEQLVAAGGDSAELGAALGDIRLGQAQVALDAKDWGRALAVIEQYKGIFTEPVQQAGALFVVAAAKEGDARAAKDKVKLRDAALAYMRVVAHFRDVAGANGQVPVCLFRTAVILEELGEKGEAMGIYRELAEGNDEGTKSASRAALERLK